ncbi:MAG: hypothetical protein IJ087_01330 [Eggerthellaceae bacterium]|nr:hypothetical protein [Eggerthellaceae bacterium]
MYEHIDGVEFDNLEYDEYHQSWTVKIYIDFPSKEEQDLFMQLDEVTVANKLSEMMEAIR